MATAVEVPEYEVQDDVQLDPERTALIVVDMEDDWVAESGSLVGPDAKDTIPRIQSLHELARGSGMRVVYSQDTHDEGDPEWKIWPEHARRGTWGWQIVDELAPGGDELIVQKVRYDAFYGTSLDHQLRLWGIDTLVICGTVANICVHYTAASAALRWYRVVIPREIGCAPDDVETVAALLELGVPTRAMRRALERGRLEDAIFDAVLDPERAQRTVTPAEIEARGGLPVAEIQLLMQTAGLPPP